MICLSACLSLAHNPETCRNGELIEMPFRILLAHPVGTEKLLLENYFQYVFVVVFQSLYDSKFVVVMV